MRRSLRFLLLVGLSVTIATASAAFTPAPASAEGEESAGTRSEHGRVLLFAVPGLTWADVDEYDLPVIEAFLDGAAVANHAPRGARVRSEPGGAYLTIGSGSRAVGRDSVDGQIFGLDDTSAGTPAGEIFERRTGVEPDGDWVMLSWPDLVRRNDSQPYDAELGALSDALADAGLTASAIGNADGADTLADSYERQVGLAVATPDGVISSGRFDVNLLVADRDATSRPFGRRLNADLFVDSFTELWQAPDTGLVVAEASDMARTMRYRGRVDRDRYDELWQQTLAESDALFGRLLERVDPAVDSVVLVAPYNLPGDRDLTVAAMQAAPGSDVSSGGGYLRSASTQRSGYVTLVDVAPTILDLLGVDRPTSMEGRPFEVSASGDTLDERVDWLVSGNEASRFRENLLLPTTLVIVVLLGVVCALAIGSLAGPDRPRWFANGVSTTGLFAVLLMPMSFVSRAFPLEELGIGFYWGFLLGSAAVIAVVVTAVAHRAGRPRIALIAALVIVVAVPAFDVTNGSQLSMSAAFGYSPTGNSRLYGISNYSLGAFGAAVSLLAAFVASRGPQRRYRLAAVGMMVAALAIIGVPIWGANVGGILSFSPVVVLFAAQLLRTRVRMWRMAVGFGLVTGVAVAAFAALDLARPPQERAHLGRLMERISDEGVGILFGFIERKGAAAIEVSFSTFWSAAVVVAVVFLVYLRRLPGRPVSQLRADIPHLTAGLVAAIAAAVFGSIANDSGTIVGGTAMLVVAVTVVWLTLEPAPMPATPSAAHLEPARQGQRSEPADGGATPSEAVNVEPEQIGTRP